MTYVKFPITTNSIRKLQNIDTYCFLCSIVANIHPIDKDPQRVTKYEPYWNELDNTNIDFTIGLNITDIPRFEQLNPTLSLNIFEFSTDENNDHKLNPLYISNRMKTEEFRFFFYKNDYILLGKLHVFISKQDRRYVCRNCYNNYTNQLELTTHKRLCSINDNIVYIPCKEIILCGIKIIRKSLYVKKLLPISKLETNL